MKYDKALKKLIKDALAEDIGDGDHSTLSIINEGVNGSAVLKIKQDCTIAGVAVAENIFRQVEKNILFEKKVQDGTVCKSGDVAFVVKASLQTILSAERLVLNCMQRMSGIATLTALYIEKLEGYKSRLLDTRKTTPNFRLLEKEAVRIGGGHNHRFGLYDMMMLKDNHIDFAGGIEKAIARAVKYKRANKLKIGIEVEARTIEDVSVIMKTGKINRIMLDNFEIKDLKTALHIIDGRYETEASGGITLDNLRDYAATGVDFISSGAIIHQAKSVDLSLKAITD